jgi:hypothetical protein
MAVLLVLLLTSPLYLLLTIPLYIMHWFQEWTLSLLSQ